MASSMTDPHSPPPAASAACRVLLAEDDHDLRQSLADYLRLRGLDVVEAASGIDFYREISRDTFDVAVVDVNLPDVSGFSLVEETAGTREMGLILLTARSGREDRVRGYDAGADIYLVKPVDGEELTLAIRNLARRTRQRTSRATDTPPTPPADDGPWTLDRQARMLGAPGMPPLRLSARETILLEYLALRAQTTVARHDIAALFESGPFDPESRRIDAALARLRTKIVSAGKPFPLQVVHGKGLRLLRPIRVV